MLTFTSSIYKGQEGVSGFPGEVSIYDIANDLRGRVVHYIDDEGRVYPRLRFNCNGTIRGVTLIAYINSYFPTIHLVLGLWRPRDRENQPLCYEQENSLIISLAPSNGPGFGVVTYSTPNDVNVEPGTILNLQQLDGVLLYRRPENGLPNYPVNNSTTLCNQTNDEENLDFPFISVNIGTCH